MAVLRHSITDVRQQDAAQVVVTGSHGGVYSAAVAAAVAPAGVVFHDAGVGLDSAGIAGLAILDDIGIPAATVNYLSSRIGNAEDVLRRGRISHINEAALAMSVRVGQPCTQATALLDVQRSEPLCGHSFALKESRIRIDTGKAAPVVWALDSASLVVPEDANSIVVTGSHGGLVGGSSARALGADALLAAFNDAGVGIDEAGIGRLPALDRRGIAAVAVSHMSARIGCARSSWETGSISHINETARLAGARPGQGLQEFVREFIRVTSSGSLGAERKVSRC